MLSLPPRIDGAHLTLEPGRGPVLVIGANGSGKTRFTQRMLSDLASQAFSLSALHGIFDCNVDSSAPMSIGAMYEQMHLSDIYKAPDSQLECLLRMMMHQEMTNLISRKLRGDKMPVRRSADRTRLDDMMDLWREIFPGNSILVHNGRVSLSRANDRDIYSPMKLSTGEKAVMFYIAGMLFAPEGATVFVENPSIFLHPTVATMLWDKLEALRPDCTIVYTTHDLDFASTRSGADIVWVRDYDMEANAWDYDILPPEIGLSDDIYLALLGSKRPVLFIEGDGVNSIDSKLYPLIFHDYTVKSLGSCNKVIEATRTFNDLKSFHHLDSNGIVDRDRRDEGEVAYLRGRGIFVPDVAEVENLLLLEEVIRAMAQWLGKDEDVVFGKVKRAVMNMFRADVRRQALLHTRHRVKRTMEYRVDGKFSSVSELEEHIDHLINEINPRATYERFCREFSGYLAHDDYASVLRVYNQKSMLPGSNVASLLGLKDKKDYLRAITDLLRSDHPAATRLRNAVVNSFGFDTLR